MTTRMECAREAAVVAAVRHDRWSDELREHASACPGCAEAVFVALHLGGVAAGLDERPLPDPRLVWLRARLERRRRELRRANSLVTAMHSVAAAVGAAGAVALIVRLWPSLREAAMRGLAGALPTPTTGATDYPVAVIGASLVVLVVLALTEP